LASRAYTVATVAVALNVERKWVDNVLTHYRVRGASQQKQGIARRLSSDAVFILRVALSLSEALGVPISRSIDLATKLVDGRGSYVGPDGVSLAIDFSGFEGLVHDRLAAAVEVAPVPIRGRPSQNKTGRLD
jgi:hypothetical protein